MKPMSTRDHPAPLVLEGFLPYRLVVLAQAASQGLAELYSQRFGVTIAEWRVLATLGQHSTLTAKDIGAHSCMHKTKVSRALAAMIKRGLVRREANPRDRREAFVTLTSAGNRLYGEIVPLARSYAGALVEGVNPQDLAAFERVIAVLASRTARENETIPPDLDD